MSAYRVKNLDCANCAVRLEEGIRKLPGVKAVSIDFGTLSMRLEAEDHAAVVAEAARLEPDVSLELVSEPIAPAIEEAGYEARREAILLGASLAIALAGFFLQGTFASAGLPWASLACYVAAWALSGWNVVLGAIRELLRGQALGELFLMSIATLGAFALGEYEEAVGVMLFYKVGEILQESATLKSRRSIRALLALRPDSANVLRGGQWQRVSPEAVAVGDSILVRPGERVPLDGTVLEGEGAMETAAMTGEPVPRAARPGSLVLSGFIAQGAAFTIRADKVAGESSAARVVELVENAVHAKAPTERLVSRFARYYTPAVVGIAAAIAFLPPLVLGQSLSVWGYRALVMLVISCPCALVVSIPLGYFGGLGGAARRGILAKGANVLDTLAEAGTVVLDKTGTLTRGIFVLKALKAAPGFDEARLLAVAAAAESASTHPIAHALAEAAQARGLVVPAARDQREAAGKGVEARLGDSHVLVGTLPYLMERGVPRGGFDDGEASGDTVVHVATDGAYSGRIHLGDELRADAVQAIERLRAAGVQRIALLSGDAEGPVRAAAQALGIEEYSSGLLPEGKLAALEAIIGSERARNPKSRVVFVGDGINDAPVLARADCGIAMGGSGSDVAVETADAVLMSDEPSRAAEAIERARRTRRIVVQNIVGALAIKLGFLALGAFGLAAMWEAVIADVGVALLAILNATRAMK